MNNIIPHQTNLPDKEFRYLRTVIVTAAVHRGFGCRLPCHQVTNFLDLPALGRRQSPYMILRLCGDLLMQAPLELVGLRSSSSMDSFASWKMNGSRMEKGKERGDATSRRR
ncbi:putative protein ORF91 [Glycine soja]|uniref:Uncharacterized protein n=1 Tax=Glycine soja TaxID=3848 RepID=A0A445FEF3_GLYSO|nr:putative protein ORF91 [Glycine soja]